MTNQPTDPTNPTPSAHPEPVGSEEQTAPNPVLSPVEGLRTFGLNSPEFHEAVRAPRPSWVWGPGLPRDPPRREQQVIIEGKDGLRRTMGSEKAVREFRPK